MAVIRFSTSEATNVQVVLRELNGRVAKEIDNVLPSSVKEHDRIWVYLMQKLGDKIPSQRKVV